MSKNNTLRKSDKKFIRLEKSRIRRQFFDAKKQQELIDELYKRFIKSNSAVTNNAKIQANQAEENQMKEKAESKNTKEIKVKRIKTIKAKVKNSK